MRRRYFHVNSNSGGSELFRAGKNTEDIDRAATMKQTTFASLAFERQKKQTRGERFPAEMEKVVPWAALLAVIEAHKRAQNID